MNYIVIYQKKKRRERELYSPILQTQTIDQLDDLISFIIFKKHTPKQIFE